MSGALSVDVVFSYGVVGGAERVLLGLLDPAEGADRLDLDLTGVVLAEPGDLADAVRTRGFRAVDSLPTGSRPIDLIRPIRALRRRWKDAGRRPDVCIALGTKAALVAGAAGRLHGVRVVWLSNDHAFDGLVKRVAGVLVDAACSDSAAVAVETGVADILTLRPTRPAEAMSPREAREHLAELGVSMDGLVLGVAGRLTSYKGFDDAISALALPAARGWRLAVIGDDDPAEPGTSSDLRDQAIRLGVADRVHFLGRVPDAARILSGLDAAAVLTKSDGGRISRESVAMVGLEAMSAGIPVVFAGASDAATMATEGDPAGIAIPAGSPADLARALDQLRDSDTRRAMGERGRVITSELPPPERQATTFVALLASTARRAGRGLPAAVPVSVVTTCLNESQGVALLLDALVPQLRSDDELIVVDGGSSDDTADLVRRRAEVDGRIHLLEVPGAGISQGRNAGIRRATHDWVVMTDVGCHPAPQWLDAMRAAAGAGPALVTGAYEVSRRSVIEEAIAAVGYPRIDEARHPSLWQRAYTRLLGRGFDATLPTGRSMAVRRADALAVGGFPEDLQTGEDVLFGRRLLESRPGARAVLATDASVVWDQRDTLRAQARMFYRYGLASGATRHPVLLGRDLARAGALLAGLPLLGHPRTRGLAAAGMLAYLSLPVARAARSERPLSAALVPLAALVRDSSKAVGALSGLIGRRA